MTTATIAAKQTPRDNYDELLQSLRDQFGGAIVEHRHLFTTDAVDLFDVFLDALPLQERQHHTCHACRHFVTRYGHVVTISPDGETTPVMWGPAPSFYGTAFKAVRDVVARARVNGIFYNSERTWGTPVTGIWQHMAVTPPEHLVFQRTALRTAGQAMAERREEYRMLQRGLADFPPNLVEQALLILKAEALYRSEKCLGVAEWLAELHAARSERRGERRNNVTWLAVASAPSGYCHVRSTMIGTLLEDLAAGKSFADVKRAFGAKMHPLQYQRPQAPPKSGNIARAEKIVSELDSAGALERRYARLDEVKALWTPKPEKPASGGGVFSHLRGNSNEQVELPATTITWVKFARTVLPEAHQIEVYVPDHGPFIALCTAVNPDAPAIIQWDEAEQRNPVSWYVYHAGSPARQWSLTSRQYRNVTAVALLPHLWYNPDRYRHQGEGAVLIIDGCRDTRRTSAGLFPEIMRAEYREIRSTIEAHSRSMTVKNAADASACGIDLRKGRSWDCTVRVTSPGRRALYRLDRWD